MTRAVKWVVWPLLLFAVAAIVAPFFSADRFGDAIRNSLERSLRRKVEIGKVRFSLFRGPGFTITDVVIHEAAEFGIEPMAWVDSLEVRPSVLGLLRGRIEIASLRLDDPWVNLTKAAGDRGRWNFTDLLDPVSLPAAPDVLVRNGRINFKFGGEKAVFYFSSADIDLAVSSGRWTYRVRAEAARTDRPAHAMGYFDGRGSFAAHALDFDLELEQSPAGAMIALFYGSDLGLRGFVVGRLKLQGPLDAIRINGIVRFEDVHRWDQAPSHSTWPMPVEGRLDLSGQQFRLASVSSNQDAPVALRYRVENYMTRPEWGINVTWSRFPVDVLVPAAPHFGLNLPAGTHASGTLDGSIGYSVENGIQGQIAMSETVVTLPGAPPVTVAHADWILERDRIRLRPAAIVSAEGSATIESVHRWGDTTEWTIEAPSSTPATLPLRKAGVQVPVIDSLTGGTWKGRLTFRTGIGWSGQAQLADASIELPALATPLMIKSAQMTLEGDKLTVDKLQAVAGQTEITGAYLYQPGADRPHRLQIAAASADTAELLRELAPLVRRQESLVNRALNFGKPGVPAWVGGIFAEGVLKIGALRTPAARLDNVEIDFEWEGTDLRLPVLKSRAYEGSGAIDLKPSTARIEGAYRARGLEGEWRIAWDDGKPSFTAMPAGGPPVTVALK